MTDTLFRSVDVAAFVAGFVQRLRTAGLEVGPTAANRLALAMERCPPTDVDTLYWLTKTSLLHDRQQFPTFDRLFDVVFGGAGLPIAPWERDVGRATVRTQGSLLRRSSPADGLAAVSARIDRTAPEVVETGEEAAADEGDSIVPELLPAPLAHLAETPFDQLSIEQLTMIGARLERVVTDLPERTSRRHKPATRGAVDLRRTMRSARTAGEITALARHRPRLQPRPLVMVADVSGSMESFARIHLHLMRALVARAPGRVEVFTFATSLRRVTVQLRERDPQVAIDRLSDEVPDRFGGTRIASSIGALIAGPRWSHCVRGATVIIASDGWDTDPGSELAKRMARLRRLCHRVIWINPRAASADYQPTVAGMAAALPSVDRLLSGHSPRAMEAVVDALVEPLDYRTVTTADRRGSATGRPPARTG